MTPDLTTLQGRLGYARGLKGYTQEQLGKLLGLKDGVQISRWEKGPPGYPTPSARRLPQIAQALGTDVPWLVDGSGNPPVATLAVTVSGGTPPGPERPGGELIDCVEDIAKKYAALKVMGAPPEALNALHDLLLGVYRRLFSADPFDPEHLAQRVVESILRAAEDDLDESPGIPLPR